MKVLLTGATGFLGRYLARELGGELSTLGRGEANTICCSLDREIPVLRGYDLVVHNAGWAHRVPKTEAESLRFFEVNRQGAGNLIKGIQQSGVTPRALVYISTVAVYGLERGDGIDECVQPTPLTAYAKSKYEAELILRDWADKNGVNLTVLRLPLVVGAEYTPGNLGAMMQAIRKGYYFRLGNGSARKSMVLAEDVARLVPTLMGSNGTYNLTDGQHPSVAQLEDYLGRVFQRKIKSIPTSIIQAAAWVGDRISFLPINSYRLNKLGESLVFDDSKARREINWSSRPVLDNMDF